MKDDAERRVVRSVSLRLLPILFVLYVFSYLDRSNVGIAALQMNEDLRFGSTVFGAGAGMFSVGYALFELPSNLLLVRTGARRWIALIMICWGIMASGMMFVRTPAEFYVSRFMLGLAEAGFFPGIVFYLAKWFPQGYRARALAVFAMAIPISQVLGGVVGGLLLALDGRAGLSGWQWLFLVEGFPSIILGVVAWVFLTDRPEEAHWLSAVDRELLVSRLRQDRQAGTSTTAGYWDALGEPACWLLAVMYFCFLAIGVGYTSWIALLVREALGIGNTATGFVTAGISLIAASSYLMTAKFSDKSNDRFSYVLLGLALCIAGCLGAACARYPWIELLSLTLIPIGSGVFMPSFWCLPTMNFAGESSASSIALISAVGSGGGFFGPLLIGFFKQGFAGFLALAAIGAAGLVVGFALRRRGGRLG